MFKKKIPVLKYPMNKILVGVPNTGTVCAKTAFSLAQMALKAPCEIDFHFERGCNIIWNRTVIALEAEKRGFTHLLFIDSDMFFEPDTLKKLLEVDKDIVGVNANFRRLPLQSTVKLPDGMTEMPSEPFKCDMVGFGIVLIKVSILAKIPPPWFKFEYEGFALVNGEDSYFCREAQKVGAEVWCNPQIFVKHCGEFDY